MKTVAVIGAGTMGQGIAQIAATFSHTTVLYDLQESAIKQAKEKHKSIANRLIEKGRWSREQAEQILNNITYTSDLQKISEADLVIEAIIENIAIKKELFTRIEELVSENCILATNTSSLSVTAIANACNKPARFLGLHFFNPAPLMKLVEIIPALQTQEGVINDCKSLLDSWSKVAVTAKDTPGFIVNKVARPFYGEAFRIYQENIATVEEIDTIMRNGGYRMGPFQLTDYIGHDVNYKVTQSVWEAFYYDERYKPSFVQKSLVDAGYLGRKSGRGFYSYPYEIIDVSYDQQLIPQVLNRINVMLINEAADAVFLGICSEKDVDLAMTKGVNYPEGLLALANKIGIANCVDRLDDLFDRYHESRYRCCPLLRDKANNNTLFDV